MNFFTYVIMLNLFLLITLQQYDDFYAKPVNPIEKFNTILFNFKTAWNYYSNELDDGYRLRHNQLTQFLMILDVEFSHKFNKSIDDIKKYILDLKLVRDKDGYVYFHDVLFKMFKKEYGLKDQKIKMVVKEERKVQAMVQKKINEIINKIQKTKVGINNPLNTFNPLTSHLYFKTSFLYMSQLLSKLFVYNKELFKLLK